MSRTLTRKDFLKFGGTGVAGAVLFIAAGCGGEQTIRGGTGDAAASDGASATVPDQTSSSDPRDAPMIRVEGGDYTIGTDDGPPDARPVRTVSLDPFLIDRYEVTNAQFAAYLNSLGIEPRRDAAAGEVVEGDLRREAAARLMEGSEGAEGPQLIVALDDEQSRIGISNGRFVASDGYEDHPVNEVTWTGACEYAAWRGARLPTEAEWEAAAGGFEDRTYPWGEESPTAERAVFGRSSGETAPVGSHPAGATPDGVEDMAGNVQEWTSSLYRPYSYDPNDGREDPDANAERVTRGGDHVFDSAPEQLTTFYRTGFSRAPGRGHRHIGFRCARSATNSG